MGFLLIDGHNLIGQMPNISLGDEDDEAQLVRALRSYATADRKRNVIIVFDRGVYGHPQRLDGYGITCFFARSPQDADTQLIKRINQITQPTQWRVVSSDRQVARAARDRGIKVTSSTEFVLELSAPPKIPAASPDDKPHHVRLSPKEIDEWLHAFGEEPPPRPEPASPPPTETPTNTAAEYSARRRGRKARKR